MKSVFLSFLIASSSAFAYPDSCTRNLDVYVSKLVTMSSNEDLAGMKESIAEGVREIEKARKMMPDCRVYEIASDIIIHGKRASDFH